jgi:G3E family GTPase
VLPVSIVTGFLGSGKTTLIGRCLRDPAFARTAVIVNEFGEIGLDHDLIAHSDETLLALTTGCLCCAVRSDLVQTLLDLHRRRSEGTGPFDRVLIETSGLADPAPILHALMTDPDVTAAYRLDTVATVLDSLLGAATLDRHPEARRQLAVADVVAFSKTDLAGPVPDLRARVAAANPTAALTETAALSPTDLFAAPQQRVPGLDRLPDQATHTPGIASVALSGLPPIPALALTLFLQALAEHAGPRLLRVKGLLELREMPGQPAVVHGVQHVFAAPDFLPAWPSADRTGRLVFIGTGIPPHFPARLLDAIVQEVIEAASDPDNLASTGFST